MPVSSCKNAAFAATLLFFFIVGTQVAGQTASDPHRPACSSHRCQTIRAYLKSHYCGKTPFGNGPDDGCDIRARKKPSAQIRVSADFACEWNDADKASKCRQLGQPSPDSRDIVIREMRRLGLPAKADKDVNFIVWGTASPSWTLIDANYERVNGTSLNLCQVIVVIDQGGQLQVIRQVPFQKTDAEVPLVATWSPLDIADVDSDGRAEIVLEGDAYENHWLEVFAMQDGGFKAVFSGLGYYL